MSFTTGHALPATVVDNAEVAGRVGVDADWIFERSGIRERRFLGEGESLLDLAERAARQALENAGPVDRVVVASSTDSDLAPRLAHRLGLSCGAFDVNAASAGFVHALALVDRPTLVVGAEALSRCIDWSDRDTAILFGDGAGAIVTGRPLASCFGSDGAAFDAVGISDGRIHMRGRAVYRAYVTHLPEIVREVTAAAGWTRADAIVPHQANGRALDAVARRLDLPAGVMVADLEVVGNTSAASIPIALCRARASGRIQAGDRVVVAALGAGLVWGAAALIA